MTFSARGSRLQRFRSAVLLFALGVAASLFFTIGRARRLLSNSRQIAANRTAFSRDYFVGSGPDITYLVMGDSTAAGWGAEHDKATYPYLIASALAARHFRVHVVNVAVGGATLAQVRREQSAFLQRVRPDLVTISAGANDATHGTSGADFTHEMQLLLADLGASSARTVLIANVPDMFLAPALPYPLALVSGRRARALNVVFAGLPQNPEVQLVDLHGRGKLDYQRDPGLYAADLFHPSGRGYALWAGLFERELECALASGALQGR